jgi:hypothetical protein
MIRIISIDLDVINWDINPFVIVCHSNKQTERMSMVCWQTPGNQQITHQSSSPFFKQRDKVMAGHSVDERFWHSDPQRHHQTLPCEVPDKNEADNRQSLLKQTHFNGFSQCGWTWIERSSIWFRHQVVLLIFFLSTSAQQGRTVRSGIHSAPGMIATRGLHIWTRHKFEEANNLSIVSKFQWDVWLITFV